MITVSSMPGLNLFELLSQKVCCNKVLYQNIYAYIPKITIRLHCTPTVTCYFIKEKFAVTKYYIYSSPGGIFGTKPYRLTLNILELLVFIFNHLLYRITTTLNVKFEKIHSLQLIYPTFSELTEYAHEIIFRSIFF